MTASHINRLSRKGIIPLLTVLIHFLPLHAQVNWDKGGGTGFGGGMHGSSGHGSGSSGSSGGGGGGGMSPAQRAALKEQRNHAKANIYNDQGIKLYNSGHYQRAVRNYQKARRLWPGDYNINQNLQHAVEALLLEEKNKRDKWVENELKIRSFKLQATPWIMDISESNERINNQNREHAASELNNQALLLSKQGNFEAAFKKVQEANDVSPNEKLKDEFTKKVKSHEIYTEANSLLEKGKNREALDKYLESADLDPSNTEMVTGIDKVNQNIEKYNQEVVAKLNASHFHLSSVSGTALGQLVNASKVSTGGNEEISSASASEPFDNLNHGSSALPAFHLDNVTAVPVAKIDLDRLGKDPTYQNSKRNIEQYATKTKELEKELKTIETQKLSGSGDPVSLSKQADEVKNTLIITKGRLNKEEIEKEKTEMKYTHFPKQTLDEE
ncbi:MAG: tetratricopeptide repeat protein [Bacteroidia bacterium]